jgi:energy-coupling factor transporter ATP-binding protein EcfA2
LENSYPSHTYYESFFRENQLQISPNPSINIYKIHGDRADPDSIIITKDDFDKWMNPSKNEAFKEKLRVLFREKVLLFLGYSAEDQNFRTLFKSVYNMEYSKKSLFISRHEDLWREEEWKKYGFEFIPSDAKEFVKSLLETYSRNQSNELVIERKGSNLTLDQNPFKYISAENVKQGDEDIIARYFIEPQEYAMIIEPGQNTVIEGHRGSGKSWLLRYIAMKINEDSENLAYYIKCRPEFFSTTLRESDENDAKWIRFFLHYFNLYIISNICIQLNKYIQENEKEIFLISLLNLFSLDKHSIGSFGDLIDWLYDKMDECSSGNCDNNKYTGPNHIYRFFMKLKEVKSFENVYILLDEYDNLSDDQQKVIAIHLRSRNAPYEMDYNLNFKIGVKTSKMCYEDISGKLLRLNHDYTKVSLDNLAEENLRNYKKFLEKVANKRLEEEKFNITDIKILLPKQEYNSDDEPKKIGEDYSGFDNYVELSSGIVRDYVSLIKDTLYYSFKEIAIKKVELKPIPPNSQNHVIKIKSSMHFRNYDQDIKEPEKVRRMIFTLGSLFKEIQQQSIERYYEMLQKGKNPKKIKDNIRRTSQIGIQIINRDIDPQIKELLDEATEVQLLQIPIISRQPQNKSEITIQLNYKFHRLLMPYFALAIQNRHPRNIDARIFNIIISNPDKFLRILLRKWGNYKGLYQNTLDQIED